MANKKITDLTAATTLNDDDLFPCVSGVGVSPVTEKITVANLKTVVGTGNTTIVSLSSGGDFTQTPLSNNIIRFSDVASSGIQAGDLVSFVQNGVENYYLVTGITPQSSDFDVTLAGPVISTAYPIGDITIYSKSRVLSSDLIFSGSYAINGATETLINAETRSKFRWNGAKAYLVYVAARNNQADGGATPAAINIRIAKLANLGTSNEVLTSDISLSGTGWQASSNTVDSGQYAVEFGDELEVSLVNTGTDGDSRDLTVTMVFGLEF